MFRTRSVSLSRRTDMPSGSGIGTVPGFQKKKWLSGSNVSDSILSSMPGKPARDGPLLGPLLNEGNLLIGQAEFVGKSQLLRLRQPRGHEALRHDRRNLAGVSLGISISKQWERPSFVGSVARGTVPKKNGSDIAIESSLLCGRHRGARGGSVVFGKGRCGHGAKSEQADNDSSA